MLMHFFKIFIAMRILSGLSPFFSKILVAFLIGLTNIEFDCTIEWVLYRQNSTTFQSFSVIALTAFFMRYA